MSDFSGIYGIYNSANGKWYVGQSIMVLRRKRSHFSALRRKRHANAHLQRAYDKYGVSCFEFRVLERVSEDFLDTRECFWIRYYRSMETAYGYNSHPGGGHLSPASRFLSASSRVGQKRSAETRRRMSEAALKRPPMTEETREKIVAALRVRVMSPATREKHRSRQLGKPVSPEARRKIAVANIGRKHTTDAIAKIAAAGRHPCAESTKLKISAANRGRPSWIKGLQWSAERRAAFEARRNK